MAEIDSFITLVDGDQVDDGWFNGAVLSAPPIGAILPWAKTLTGTPALPANWKECDGSVLSDAASPLNGVTLPNLNGNNNFLRGNSTSGGTGGAATHTHTIPTALAFMQNNGGGTSVASTTTDAGSSLPPYYNVVFIIRIK